MNTIKLKQFSVLLIVMLSFVLSACSQNAPENKNQDNKVIKNDHKYKITFIELGSVRCIPCKKMQPIMKSIEKQYGNDVKVVFYDVWTPKGKPEADKYNVESIPTQVFLDENGEEFYRHVGFFPEKELIKVLQKKGIK